MGHSACQGGAVLLFPFALSAVGFFVFLKSRENEACPASNKGYAANGCDRPEDGGVEIEEFAYRQQVKRARKEQDTS